MLDEIIETIEGNRGPITVKELAERLGVERSALEKMLEFLENKGKLSVYRPDEDCEECSVVSCAKCVFSGSCPRNDSEGS